MPVIAITRRLPKSAYNLLAERPDVTYVENPQDTALSSDGLIALARGADALICTLSDQIDSSLLNQLTPRLQMQSG